MSAQFLDALRPPSELAELPRFERGWHVDGAPEPYLSYAPADANWSAELEALHADATATHFLDVWTRRAVLDAVGAAIAPGSVVADLGCSSGHLLAALRAAHPSAFLVGVDAVPQGLAAAHRRVPDAAMILADVTRLPIGDATVDVAVSTNLLEHVDDDEAALAEIARVLRPRGLAALVVPRAPGLYDYYDAALGHVRRYARGELARKARGAGLEPLDERALGALLYPAFWLTKKAGRAFRREVPAAAAATLVRRRVARTHDSPLGLLSTRVERGLLAAGIRPPFGIRSLTILARP